MNALKRHGYREMPPLTKADFAAALQRVTGPESQMELAAADSLI
jgi:hypothetical protein